MAKDTQIAEGLHLVKLQAGGNTTLVTLPLEVRRHAGIFPGAGFLAVRAVGPAVVICQVKDVSADGALEEANKALDAAVKEWIAQRGAQPDRNGKARGGHRQE